jgi:predicted glycosyltransferase
MRIWVDCTAAAHPLVLRPIIERFRSLGHEVEVTAREYGQTLGVLERLGIPYTTVGAHGGASSFGKARALAGRSAALARRAWGQRYDLGIAHGSVDLAVVCGAFRIPSAQMQDYEFAGLQRRISFRVARRVLVPEAIPVQRLAKVDAPQRKLFRYPGLKEDYYLADFEPDPVVLGELGLDRERVIVVVRPPSEESEYHEQSPLHEHVLDRLASEPGVQTVVIPRGERQAAAIRERLATGDGRQATDLLLPAHAIDAQSLIAFADLVVSAGGTMNREAVALGTPVYTTFAGRMGGVDERLIEEGRLRVLRDPTEIELRKRGSPVGVREPRDPALLVKGVLGAVE